MEEELKILTKRLTIVLALNYLKRDIESLISMPEAFEDITIEDKELLEKLPTKIDEILEEDYKDLLEIDPIN